VRRSDLLYRRPNDKAQLKATLTVTLVGGTVKIGAFSYASRHDALPLLEPQSECLFILKIVNGKHHIAGTYYGAFDIWEGKLKPLTKKQGFAAEYENASASEAAADMVGSLRAMRREADPLR
jgi:hypothetical protein